MSLLWTVRFIIIRNWKKHYKDPTALQHNPTANVLCIWYIFSLFFLNFFVSFSNLCSFDVFFRLPVWRTRWDIFGWDSRRLCICCFRTQWLLSCSRSDRCGIVSIFLCFWQTWVLCSQSETSNHRRVLFSHLSKLWFKERSHFQFK